MMISVDMNDIEAQIPPATLEDSNHWDSCCLRIDKRAALFFSQLIISVVIILFSIYQLATISECTRQTPFMSLLTLVIGVWLPSPNLKKE